ncbi:50S ribosomal protein L25 [Brevibacillus ginsengisoli]|uniref:50S ribosomal protein L25 n=1 Tax=Brevibacillus ginsengisoli TaxID=363854 RepID=UPI003CE96A5F
MQTIHAFIRDSKDRQSNQLRREGWIPTVLYGSDQYNLSLKVNAKDLDMALRKQPTNLPFKLNVNGQEHNVMVYELQRHPVQGNLLHADFKQINMNEKVHTSVPIHLVGDPEYGIASLVRHSVEVSCLPRDIPESFTVDVEGLQIGDVILVKDLQVNPNVDLGLDELEVIVSVLVPKAKTGEAENAEGAAEAVAETAGSPVEQAKTV